MIDKLLANKKKTVSAICVALVIAYWYSGKNGSEDVDISYQTSPLSRGKIESIVNTAGTLSPVVTVDVGSELSGLVSELNADYNSEVTSGQLLARIDDRTIRARLKQSEADLASSKASLAQQKANLAKAQADLTLAKAELARQEELRQRSLNSQVDLDEAVAAAQISEANVTLVEAQVISAEANILQSEAQLEQAQLDLERTYIRSPVDGTVIDRQVDIGQTVAASLSAPILFQIAQDLTKMQIEADVDEADIGKISEGLPARFSVDAYPESSFDGMVSQVRKASTITSNVVTYKVIITADNQKQLLLPGMTASVDIVLGVKEDVLRVANGALRFNPPEEQIAATESSRDSGNGNEQLAAAIEEMGLTDDQADKVTEAVAEMTASIREARASVEAGDLDTGERPDRSAANQTRQRLTSSLEEVLSEDQVATVLASLRSERGNRERGGDDELSLGQVWVIDGDKARAVRLRTGLSDDLYTEVVTEDLDVDDEVIVRIARTTQ